MKIDMELDLSELKSEPAKDGQIAVHLPKDQELRFKLLNTKYKKKLNKFMRTFAIRLMDQIEQTDDVA